MLTSQYLDLSKEGQINRLINHCRHLNDVAYDLDLVKDRERIEVIDQTINDLKMQINSLKVSLATVGDK